MSTFCALQSSHLWNNEDLHDRTGCARQGTLVGMVPSKSRRRFGHYRQIMLDLPWICRSRTLHSEAEDPIFFFPWLCWEGSARVKSKFSTSLRRNRSNPNQSAFIPLPSHGVYVPQQGACGSSSGCCCLTGIFADPLSSTTRNGTY